ncbi:MAG TPA: histidine kinase [Jatrophihabitantaceae bacterium]
MGDGAVRSRAWTILVSPFVLDGLLALAVAGEALVSLAPAAPATVEIVALGTALCVALRRRHPVAVVGLTSIGFIIWQISGYFDPPLPFAPLVAIYTLAVYRPPAISVKVGSAAAAGVVASSTIGQTGFSDDLLDYPISLVAALTIGCGVRIGRARAELLEEQSAQLARDSAERTERAVEQERAHIARELHDIVAHNVSVMVAQASAANVVFESQPQQARQALTSIASVGREALVEMRRLLGVLSPCGRAGQDPMPGLDGLPSLIAQIERAGLPVQVTVEGDRRRLPAGVELSAYRIVQEALTNSLKHAGTTRSCVLLTYRRECLELCISDAGNGKNRPAEDVARTSGRGLLGMQQRAALVGGCLVAGTGDDGGFVVTALLPVAGAPR